MRHHPALLAIGAYQRYVSPRKGYGCAYPLAHGGTGCSGFARYAIAERSAIRAIPSIRARFAACKQAAIALHARKTENRKSTKREQKTRWYDHCNPCDACYCPRGKSGGADTSPDCTPDCTPDCCSL